MNKNTYLTEPSVTVGIVSGKAVTLSLHGHYTVMGRQADGTSEVLDVLSCAVPRLTFRMDQGFIAWDGRSFQEITFTPSDMEACFSLEDVTIGVHFHWQRQETQTFRGVLRLLAVEDRIQTINILPVEQYLESVISSEMSATSSPALLEAHAVISRSWLLAQMEKRAARKRGGEETATTGGQPSAADGHSGPESATGLEIIRWYDREDHTLFDVCADDHCQRYQGITRETNPHVAEAVRTTRGLLLTYAGEICDARFSKCCGGATEEFQYCWENRQFPYLRAVADRLSYSGDMLRTRNADTLAVTDGDRPVLPDLTDERQADRWIRTAPPSFCNTHDKDILAQVLNTYDQETQDFYRWTVRIGQEELQGLLMEKLGIDLGAVTDMLPVARGKSGRLYRLKIIGTKGAITLGKELEIRRALSKTHLYSSAFVIDREYAGDSHVPASFILTGAGWGHGVGLCQIGAAVMGAQGYDYRQILAHYYPGAEIKKVYE